MLLFIKKRIHSPNQERRSASPNPQQQYTLPAEPIRPPRPQLRINTDLSARYRTGLGNGGVGLLIPKAIKRPFNRNQAAAPLPPPAVPLKPMTYYRGNESNGGGVPREEPPRQQQQPHYRPLPDPHAQQQRQQQPAGPSASTSSSSSHYRQGTSRPRPTSQTIVPKLVEEPMVVTHERYSHPSRSTSIVPTISTTLTSPSYSSDHRWLAPAITIGAEPYTHHQNRPLSQATSSRHRNNSSDDHNSVPISRDNSQSREDSVHSQATARSASSSAANALGLETTIVRRPSNVDWDMVEHVLDERKKNRQSWTSALELESNEGKKVVTATVSNNNGAGSGSSSHGGGIQSRKSTVYMIG